MTVYQSTPVVNTPVEYLYRLRDQQGELLYVGITRDWPTRMKQHQADKPWWSDVANVELVRVLGTRQQIEAIEKAVIRAETPTYNKVHNALGPFISQNQRDADQVNALLVADGYPPLAWVDNDDRKCNTVRLLRGDLLRVAHKKMAQIWCDLHDESDPYPCARRDVHDCTTTAKDVVDGIWCELPENLSFT
jgi:predicted GIY-YIG superfamily endonuclease